VATEDEVRRLILEVVGEEKVHSLKKATDEERESLEKLPKAHRDVGYAALEASRGIEDLQYGLGGVINNIPGLVIALGGTAGLTAAISLLAVGVNQLVKHWDDLGALFDKGFKLPETTDQVERLTEAIKKNHKEMEVLEKQTHHTFEETEKYSQLVTKTAIAEKNLADEKKIRAAAARVGVEKPEDVARGAAFAQGATGYRAEILKGLITEGGYTPAVAEQILGQAAMGSQISIDTIMPLLPQKVQSHIRAGMPEFQAQVKAADEETKRIEEDNKLAEKHRAQTLQSFEDEERELKTQQQEDKKDRTEKQQAEKHAHAEKVKANHQAATAAKHAASVEQQRAKHEAGLIEDAFADRAQFLAKRAMGQGFSPAQVQSQMAAEFARMGATRGGAEEAAKRQMEKVMVDIAKNGGLGAALVHQQGKLMLHLQQQQEQQRRMLEAAQQDLQRGWDNAFRRGK
jgi:hypothetical protein